MSGAYRIKIVRQALLLSYIGVSKIGVLLYFEIKKSLKFSTPTFSAPSNTALSGYGFIIFSCTSNASLLWSSSASWKYARSTEPAMFQSLKMHRNSYGISNNLRKLQFDIWLAWLEGHLGFR